MRRTWYQLNLEAKAQAMRTHPTKPEASFRASLDQVGIDYRSQVTVGRYVVDFVIPSRMLVIEIDGKQHRRKSNAAYDKRRTQFLETCGFRVIRVPNKRVERFPFRNLKNKRRAKQNAFGKAIQRAAELIAPELELDELLRFKAKCDREAKKMIALPLPAPRLVKVQRE